MVSLPLKTGMTLSPSSRRAWIEITMAYTRPGTVIVALLAEGVDRNQSIRFSTLPLLRRPPRGGRG